MPGLVIAVADFSCGILGKPVRLSRKSMSGSVARAAHARRQKVFETCHGLSKVVFDETFDFRRRNSFVPERSAAF